MGGEKEKEIEEFAKIWANVTTQDPSSTVNIGSEQSTESTTSSFQSKIQATMNKLKESSETAEVRCLFK